MNIFAKAALAALAVTISAGAALAQYPDRPITMIVPFAAGGGTDATGRIIATLLEEKLGQPVNVENRTGAGGLVGHEALKAATPDGYTIGILTTELSMFQPVGSGQITYEDFTLIGLYNADPSAVYVKADSPYQTIEDLVAAVQANPTPLRASGATYGGLNHVTWVSLVQAVGAPVEKAMWVPTDGASASLQLLASGAIDVSVSQLPEAQALVDAGEIRPLVYLGNERNAKAADVPAITEALGFEFAISGWRGLGAPKGMPDDIRTTLVEAFEEIVASPQFNEVMDGRNYGVVFEGGADFEAYLQTRAEAFNAAISSAGIKAN